MGCVLVDLDSGLVVPGLVVPGLVQFGRRTIRSKAFTTISANTKSSIIMFNNPFF